MSYWKWTLIVKGIRLQEVWTGDIEEYRNIYKPI